jgi:hypothetical protein
MLEYNLGNRLEKKLFHFILQKETEIYLWKQL